MDSPTLVTQGQNLRRVVAEDALQAKRAAGDAYLRLQLDQQTTVVVSMDHAQEVLVVPIQAITAMPNMHPCILGLLNRRSRVLWVVDLAGLLELQPLDANLQQYSIAIVRVGQVPLGLVVQSVKGVTRFPTDAIQSPIGIVAPGLTPFLRGCVLQQDGILLVLDAEAIVNSPLLRSY